MQLSDCNLDPKVVLLAPAVVTRPTQEWRAAFDEGAIPEGLFRLYSTASFLSYGAAEGSLADSRGVLFGYFGTLMRGLRDLCIEGREELDFLERVAGDFFNPRPESL